jgi:hypothetical protein
MDNYPIGAKDDLNAPYNSNVDKIRVQCTISVTYLKDVTVLVPEDYDANMLKEAVEDSEYLPLELAKHLANTYDHGYMSHCANWIIDDYEVVD